jgi:hypothetical protein
MTTQYTDVRDMMDTATEWTRIGMESAFDAQNEWLKLGASQTAAALALTRETLELYGRAAENLNSGCQSMVEQARESFRSAADRVADVE